MKKILLGTSALVVAGLAAASAPAQAQTQPFGSPNFAVTVGGYARQYVTAVGQDNAGLTTRKGVDQTSDNRLILTFRAAVPNGMSAGAVWQINPNAGTSSGNSITRRMWSFLEGSFGQVQLGGADNVAAQGAVSAPEAFNGGFVVGDNNALGINVNRVGVSAAGPQAGNPSTGLDIDGISNKIVYWTPRIEGFQLGLNYTPTMSYRQGVDTTNNQYLNGFAGNLNFTRTFGSLGVKASAGYVTFEKPSGVNLTTATQNSLKNPSAYNAGLSFNLMGFDFGGSYSKMDNWRGIGAGSTTQANAAVADGLRNFNGYTYDLGIGYTFGAAMVSVNYASSRNDHSTVTNGVVAQQANGKDKIDVWGASGRYTLAPGVMANLGVFTAKYVEGDGVNASFFNSTKSSSRANGVVTGLTLTF